MVQAPGQTFAQLLDRGRLVAGRFEVGNQPEVGHINLVSVRSSIPEGTTTERTF